MDPDGVRSDVMGNPESSEEVIDGDETLPAAEAEGVAEGEAEGEATERIGGEARGEAKDSGTGVVSVVPASGAEVALLGSPEAPGLSPTDPGSLTPEGEKPKDSGTEFESSVPYKQLLVPSTITPQVHDGTPGACAASDTFRHVSPKRLTPKRLWIRGCTEHVASAFALGSFADGAEEEEYSTFAKLSAVPTIFVEASPRTKTVDIPDTSTVTSFGGTKLGLFAGPERKTCEIPEAATVV
mmetsp:Transcript_12057/g.21612  ORF Transcript_12057/g.21612 Transcript_12057/m.21612 type:complete len:240 (+) Transcript_12057:932-1651(+)